MPQIEGDNYSFNGYEIQGPELGVVKNLNHASEVIMVENNMDGCPVSKKTHQFYFVKFRPYEDPELKAKIEEAQKLIQSKNEDRSRISENIDERKSLRDRLKFQLKWLPRQGNGYSWERKEMEYLQQALDAKSASRRKHTDLIRNFHYRMLHETNSLVEEKELLRETKQLEETRDKIVASHAKEVERWDYLGSKEEMQDRIKILRIESREMKKNRSQVWSTIEFLKKEMETVDKDLNSLWKELTELYIRKGEAHACILYLRKQYDEANAYYYQHLSVLNNARKLARNKDLEALQEFSRTEVEKFMCQWNNNKAFRDDYEKRIWPSLCSQQLKMD